LPEEQQLAARESGRPRVGAPSGPGVDLGQRRGAPLGFADERHQRGRRRGRASRAAAHLDQDRAV